MFQKKLNKGIRDKNKEHLLTELQYSPVEGQKAKFKGKSSS